VKFFQIRKQPSLNSLLILLFILLSCSPVLPEEAPAAFKGIWVSDPTEYSWETMIRNIKKIGITDIFVNFASSGVAFYPSKRVPVKNPPDPLKNLITAAHKQGIRVHAKILAFFMHWAPPEEIKKMIKRGRCLKDLKGKVQWQSETPWTDPSQRENRELVQDLIREILDQFDVDGIQLDYIRFYEEPDVPRSITRIRKSILTNFVADTGILINKIKPGIQYSACVFYDLARAKKQMAQDWETWANKKIFSFLVPMNYTLDLSALYQWLNMQTRILAPSQTLFYPGLGAYLYGMTPTRLYKEIKLVETFHVPGYVLFAYTDDFAKKMIAPLVHPEDLLNEPVFPVIHRSYHKKKIKSKPAL
jgi:uncharacterized lipoprotein YddW (UPF0748 family)